MKIKTITCHDVYNSGASLQAYALSKYLNDLGHDTEIINYKPDYLSRHYSLTYAGNSRFNKPIVKQLYILAKLPRRLSALFSKRKKEYDNFTAKLPLTEKRYVSNEDLKANPPLADVYFAGSDQIWNTLFNNGKDHAFYLDFAPKDSIKASYAASFATATVAEEYKPQIKKWLLNLDFISVREKTGVEIIENLGIKGATTVLDPVFLLEEEKWSPVCKKLDLKDEYILTYAFNGDENIKSFVFEKAKKEGLKIYSVLDCDYADKCFYNEGPAAFLSLVKNAKFVVSNSFHATAFSLIFKKQFVVFNRVEGINSRMTDLLKIAGLENRLVLDASQPFENINYDLVLPKLTQHIEKSKKYIDSVLKKEEIK